MFILFCERAKRARMHTPINIGKDWEYISEFRKALDELIKATRSVQYYADHLNVTRKKLNQATQKFLGKSAKKVIEERVVLEVKRLLLYTTCTVKEIGFSLGFTDPTNFNKFFKKHTQITPAQYRKMRPEHIHTINRHEITM
jgi:AraC-like DNA-binding protein